MTIHFDPRNNYIPAVQPVQTPQPLDPIVTTTTLTNTITHVTYDAKYALELVKFHREEVFKYFIQSNATNDMRYKLAVSMAEMDPYWVSDCVGSFNILEESQRYHIATIIAKKWPKKVCENVNKYELNNEKYLYDLALQLSEGEPCAVAHNIEWFKIRDPFLFTKKIVETHPEVCCFYCEKLNLSSEEKFVIAKLVAEINPAELCKQLRELDFTAEQRMVLAELIVEKDPVQLCEHIHYFTDTILFAESPQKRLRLAETVVVNNALVLCQCIKQLGIFDSEKRFELATKALEENPYALCRNIKKFSLSKEQLACLGERLIIKDPTALCKFYENFSTEGEILFAHEEHKRLALAKATASERSYETLAENIKRLAISDVEQRFELAKIICTSRKGYVTFRSYSYIPDFELNQEQLFTLVAELVKQKRVFEFCDFFDHFNILDESKRFYLLMQIIQTEDGPYYACQYFEKFKIKNLQYQLECVEAIIKKRPGSLLQHIDKFRCEVFASKEKKVALAKAVAEINPNELSSGIEKLNLTDNNLLFSLAKIIAEKAPIEITLNLEKYKLTEEQCFITAKIVAQYNAEYFPYYVDTFKITNQENRFILAQIVAENKKGAVKYCFDIERFNLNSEQTFFMAKILAVSTMDFIDNYTKFKLTSEQFLVVAELMIEKDPEGFGYRISRFNIDKANFQILTEKLAIKSPVAICKNFDKFKDYYIDENKRFELAKAVSEKDEHLLCRKIKDLNITDQEKRYVLARTATHYFCDYCKDFQLTQEQIFNLAKIMAKENTHALCSDFEKLNISDENQLMCLAEIVIETNPSKFLLFFENFEIRNDQNLFILAELIAKKSPGELCMHIEKFQLFAKNEERIISLAKATAEEEPGMLCVYVSNLNINDESFLFSLAKIVGEKRPMALGKYIHNFNIENAQEIVNVLTSTNAALFIFSTIINNTISEQLNFDRKTFFHVISTHPDTNQVMCKSVNQIHVQLDYINLTSLRHAIEKNHTNYSEKANNILSNFLALCNLHPNQNFIKQSIINNPELLIDIFSIRDINLLKPLLFSFFEINCEMALPQNTTPFFLMWSTTAKFKHFLRPKDLRDNLFTNPLIHLLVTVKSELQLSNDAKSRVFRWVFEDPKNKGQILVRGNIIRAICNFKGASKLAEGNYESILRQLALELLPQLKECTNEQLQKTFLSSRQPFALFAYAGTLAGAKDEVKEALPHLGEFAREVALGEFPHSRRENVHLEKISPAILEVFHQGGSKKVEVTIKGEKQDPQGKVKEILRNALNDNHIRDEDLVGISNIPQENRNFADFKKNSIKDLEEKIAINQNNDYLKLQLTLLQLTQRDVTLEEYNIAIKSITPFFKPESLFITLDVPSLNRLFVIPKDRHVTLHLNDTDNPYDILLCGTEVEGSCQRIDGSPSLNQGLLGYLLNGQTRLLTMKENSNGPIKGRAIFRLLLDQKSRPVLFFERIYPQAMQDELKRVLIDFALERGKQLGLPVFRSGYSDTITLQSLGGRASEYVDGASGVQKDAVYKINNSEPLA